MNERIEYIKIHNSDLDRIKDWKEYERVTLVAIEEEQPISYHNLCPLFLELKNLKKVTKDLFKHIKEETKKFQDTTTIII